MPAAIPLGRQARIQRVDVGADAERDARGEEDRLADVIEQGEEADRAPQDPGDDRVQPAGHREHRAEFAHAQGDVDGNEAADQVSPQRAGSRGGDDRGGHDQQRRRRRDVGHRQREVAEDVQSALELGLVAHILEQQLTFDLCSGVMLLGGHVAQLAAP
jgi:hypothetical protein